MTEEVDPVKRTIYYVPKVIQPRGRLRWIGDAIASGVSKVADRMGINPYGFRRRQGVPPSLGARMVEFMISNIDKIPIKQIFQ